MWSRLLLVSGFAGGFFGFAGSLLFSFALFFFGLALLFGSLGSSALFGLGLLPGGTEASFLVFILQLGGLDGVFLFQLLLTTRFHFSLVGFTCAF